MASSFPVKKIEETAFGIYDDLDNADLGTQIHQLQERNVTLVKHIEVVCDHVNALNKEIQELKTTQENLKKNISELFNTAKSEIARKDRMIAELRKQLDDAYLQRHKRPVDNRSEWHSGYSDNLPKRPKYDVPLEDPRLRNDKRRDHHDRERSRLQETLTYRDDPRRRRSRSRGSSKDRRKSNHKSSKTSRHEEKKPSRSVNTCDIPIKDNKKIAIEDKLKDDIVMDCKENHISVDNPTSGTKKYLNSADNSKVSLELHVKLEQSEVKEINKEDEALVMTLKEEVKVESFKNEAILANSEANDRIIKVSNCTDNGVLNNSAQEIVNAVDSIKDESFTLKVNDAVASVETIHLDSNNKSIINSSSSSSCSNKSYRSKRRRCVISVIKD